MRRLKRSTAFLQCPRDCLREWRASPTRRDLARIKSRGNSVVAATPGDVGNNPSATPAATVPVSAGVRFYLIKLENVLLVRGNLAQAGAARRNVNIVRATHGTALLSCDGTQAKDSED